MLELYAKAREGSRQKGVLWRSYGVVQIDRKPDCFHLLGELKAPGIRLVESDVHDTAVIGRQLNAGFMQRTNAVTAQLGEKVAKLKYDVLACPRRLIFGIASLYATH